MSSCHDHQACIDEALQSAREICAQADARFTDLREQVFLLIWQSHKPLGAYVIMDKLAELSKRRIAPPTVYRALEFLLDLKLIHRINSLNAYIGCTNPKSHQSSALKTNYFLICSECHDTQEIISPLISDSISQASSEPGFVAQKIWLEVTGLCKQCQP
jgi:Fur family zinc uptake transcriptional regulator